MAFCSRAKSMDGLPCSAVRRTTAIRPLARFIILKVLICVFGASNRWVMAPVGNSWNYTKVGGGPVPIETSEGWLMIYHGVLTSCNGYVYSAGVALLDLDKPWKVIARSRHYILSPQTLYECVGDVPNVVFPCALLCDAATKRLAIYYGAADTATALAFAYVDELVAFAKKDSLV